MVEVSEAGDGALTIATSDTHVMLSGMPGPIIALPPEEAVRISEEILQAAIMLVGQKAWDRPRH